MGRRSSKNGGWIRRGLTVGWKRKRLPGISLCITICLIRTIVDCEFGKKDIKRAIELAGKSAPGPDGIPFAVLKSIRDILAPILYDTVQGMISGSEVLYDKFTVAFLICLPKSDAEVLETSGTRPLSIVDAVNRILASIF